MASLIYDFPNLPPDVQEKIWNSPGLPPPDGVVPDFENPSNRNGEAIALAVVCLFLATTAFLSRAYSRVFIIKKVEMQDYLGLVAFVAYIALAWVYLRFLYICGFSVHQWNVTFRDTIPIAKILVFGLTISYSGTLLFAKMAILLEWVRIFSPHRTRFFYWASYSMALLNALLYISSIVASAVTCIPHESIWYPWVSGRCMDRKALGLFTAFFNVIMDLLILLLPQKIIWTLQMTTSRRIGISLIFSVGLLATICAAGRVVATFGIQYEGDATYTVSPILLWAFPEVTCVLLVFCLPSIPKSFAQQGPLFKAVRTMRSWTRLSTPRTRKSSDSLRARNTWVATPRKLPGSHEGQISHQYGQAASLTELELVRSKRANGYNGDEQAFRDERPLVSTHPQLGRTSNPTILRTTEFELHEDSASVISADRNVENQHPWMAR